jgi:uncharacterized protein (TIGR00251 family)
MLSIQSHPSGLLFKVHVQPRSSRDQVVGLHGDALKVKLIAPPVEGKANKACIELLAEALGVPKSSLAIISGQTGRLKRVLLVCSASHAPLFQQRLEDLASRHGV